MAGLRAQEKEVTRRLLLTTALEIFEAKGYAATTVDDIAGTAGTTRVTFYAYFPSRSDLMKELIAELNSILERTSSPDHGSTAGDLVAAVRDGSRDAIGAWLIERSKQWDTIRPYTVAAFEAAAVDPELRTLVNRWIEEVASDVEDGLDGASRFAPESRHMRGVLAFAQLDHVARTWAQGRDRQELDTMLEVLTESWWKLLGDSA